MELNLGQFKIGFEAGTFYLEQKENYLTFQVNNLGSLYLLSGIAKSRLEFKSYSGTRKTFILVNIPNLYFKLNIMSYEWDYFLSCCKGVEALVFQGKKRKSTGKPV